MPTTEPLNIAQELAAFITSMQWKYATEQEKSLVLGNLNAFAARLEKAQHNQRN